MTTPDSSRTYAYHFAKINDKSNRLLSFNQDKNDFASNFNNISFRYLAQCHQNDKRLNSHQTDLSKFSVVPEKTTQPLKKYTFSILAKQQKQLRNSENADYARTETFTPKYTLNMNKTPRNNQGMADVENGEQISLKKHATLEYKKQNSTQHEVVVLRMEKIKLQADIQQLKAQNAFFKVRFQESSKIRYQKEEQIKILNSQIEVAKSSIESLSFSLADVQNRVQILQQQYERAKRTLQIQNKSGTNLKVDSNVLKQTLLFSQVQSKGSNEQQTQIDIQKYQQYKGLLAGLNSEMEDCNAKIIQQIKKNCILSEQNDSLRAAYSEAERQRLRLLHHFKNNQGELIRLCNLNTFLNSEITKASLLIANCNQEINLLNMRELEQKMMMKYACE